MALSPSQAFGKAVSEVRTELGLSQEEAALAGGIDRAYFGHIERATKTPTLKTVWKVANALKVQPSELLRRTERILGS
ncbi:MAG TPA: helix-turn-helix transcriptional regulator [Solirubrobacterales bacterium]|jgi:transcriptional regulator with XRE-family HTH domain